MFLFLLQSVHDSELQLLKLLPDSAIAASIVVTVSILGFVIKYVVNKMLTYFEAKDAQMMKLLGEHLDAVKSELKELNTAVGLLVNNQTRVLEAIRRRGVNGSED